jgi:hypothetical protein
MVAQALNVTVAKNNKAAPFKFIMAPPFYCLGGATFGTTGIQPPGQLSTYG